MLGGGADSGPNGNSRGSAAQSSILSTVGARVASEIVSSSVRALHQDSISRLSYKEECRRAVERGEPVPEPPKASFIGKQIGDALENSMNSVTGIFAT